MAWLVRSVLGETRSPKGGGAVVGGEIGRWRTENQEEERRFVDHLDFVGLGNLVILCVWNNGNDEENTYWEFWLVFVFGLLVPAEIWFVE